MAGEHIWVSIVIYLPSVSANIIYYLDNSTVCIRSNMMQSSSFVFLSQCACVCLCDPVYIMCYLWCFCAVCEHGEDVGRLSTKRCWDRWSKEEADQHAALNLPGYLAEKASDWQLSGAWLYVCHGVFCMCLTMWNIRWASKKVLWSDVQVCTYKSKTR